MHACTHISTSMYIYIYNINTHRYNIYIYIYLKEKERERQGESLGKPLPRYNSELHRDCCSENLIVPIRNSTMCAHRRGECSPRSLRSDQPTPNQHGHPPSSPHDVTPATPVAYSGALAVRKGGVCGTTPGREMPAPRCATFANAG